MNNHSLKAVHMILLGACAVSAQTLFAREILALFSGTEFVIGLVMAAWLFWIGMGGIIGGKLKCFGGKADFEQFFVVSILVAVLLPSTILAIRGARSILVNPPGSLPSLGSSLLVSVTITAPFCFFYGVLYNIASKLWKSSGETISSSASRVYIYESVGSVFGALLFSFLLIVLLPQFLAALTLSLLVFSALLFVPFDRRTFAKRALVFSAVSFAIIFFSRGIDRYTMGQIFRGYRIEDVQFSKYGEIVLASHKEELTVFSQGSRLLSVPEPERVEEIVHIPMLLNSNPRDILLVGGSLGGSVYEILKYRSVRRVDCLELDKKILNLKQKVESWSKRGAFFARNERRETAGSGVVVSYIHSDGRFFLGKAKNKYDVIIVNAPPPMNLQINRYYTVQFFREAKRALKKGGLIGFIHPSSENFVTFEQAAILRSLEMTLASVFKHVVVLPGTSAHFVAGDDTIDTGVILERLRKRGIKTRFINVNYLPYRFSKERIAYLDSVLRSASAARVNNDNRPFVSFLELLLEGRKMQFGSIEILGRLIYVRPRIPFVLTSLILLMIVLVSRKRNAARAGVWIVGFTSFLLEILVLLQFQSFSGLLYHAFILLTAVFMAGAAIGAYLLLRLDGQRKRQLATMHAAFVAGIGVFLILSRGISNGNIPYPAGISVFMGVSFAAGFLTGSYYPVVLSLALKDKGMVPSEYYAWDLFGACVGGATGGVLFFPIMGVVWTGISLMVAHLAAMIFLPRRI